MSRRRSFWRIWASKGLLVRDSDEDYRAASGSPVVNLTQVITQSTRVFKTEFAQNVQEQMASTLLNTRLKRQRLRFHLRPPTALPT